MRIAKKHIYKQVSKPKNIARAFNGHICGAEEWMKLDMLEKYSGARARDVLFTFSTCLLLTFFLFFFFF